MATMNTVLEPLTGAQEQKVHRPEEQWTDEFAGKVVRQDIMLSEADRTRNHDWRWSNADELYLAYVRQKYWEGTKIPRSSLGVHTAFEQVESMVPKVVSAIFGNPDWFEADPLPGTTPDQARHTKWIMLAQLEDKRVNAKEVFRRAIKSGYIYGNGIIEQGWIRRGFIEQIPEFFEIDEMGRTFHPLLGWIGEPTGRKRTVMRWLRKWTEENYPYVKYTPLAQFYIDKNATSPIVEEARWCAVREYVTVDFMDRLRDNPEFNIPDRPTLIQMAKHRVQAQADITMSAVDFYKRKMWEPYTEGSVDPGSHRFELFRYYTKERSVWMGNRNFVFHNRPNKYGFKPFYNIFYTDVPNRFYGLGVPDVVEGEQRLQAGIINGRIDELHLALHPHTIKKRGKSIPSYSLRRRPGGVTEADDPGKDVVREEVPNITSDAHHEVAASENRVQKITGGSDLALLGAPTMRGNSANRTATGVNQQAQATEGRIHGITDTLENTALETMLYNHANLNSRFLRPDQRDQFLGENQEQLVMDPRMIIPARLKFKIRASSKMRARQTLVAMFPLFAQTILNPEWLALLAKQQRKTIDVEEFFQMVLDATVYSHRRSLFRDLTPEEIQGMNQPPIEEVIRSETQRDRMAAQERIGREKNVAGLLKSAIEQYANLSNEDEGGAVGEGGTEG